MTLFYVAPSSPDERRFALDDNHFVTWVYDAATKAVVFTVTATLSPGDWVALGISNDNRMAETDVIHMGINTDGTPVVSDR